MRCLRKPARMRRIRWFGRLVDTVIGRLRQGVDTRGNRRKITDRFPDDPRMRVDHETLFLWVYSPNNSIKGYNKSYHGGRKTLKTPGPSVRLGPSRTDSNGVCRFITGQQISLTGKRLTHENPAVSSVLDTVVRLARLWRTSHGL